MRVRVRVRERGDASESLRQPTLNRLFLPLADLRLETGLDGADGSLGAARLAGHEVKSVLLGQDRVGRLACFASNVFDWMSRNKWIRSV